MFVIKKKLNWTGKANILLLVRKYNSKEDKAELTTRSFSAISQPVFKTE